MSTNPEIVTRSLIDFKEKLHRWNQQLRSTFQHSHYRQVLGEEKYNRISLRTKIIANQVSDDTENCVNVKTQVLHSDQDIDVVNKDLLAKKKSIQKIAKESKEILHYWQVELNEAQLWLAKAEDWLAKALRELELAQSRLRTAINEYEAAKRALKRCQNNENRSECNSEIKRVNKAVDAVNYYQVQVKIAISEAEKAQIEVNKAEAQVALCEQGVKFSEVAVSYSEEATADIFEAENTMQQNFGHIKSAELHLNNALEKNSKNTQDIQEIQQQYIVLAESKQKSKSISIEIEKTEESINKTTYLIQKFVDEKINILGQFGKVIPIIGGSSGKQFFASNASISQNKGLNLENEYTPLIVALPKILSSLPGWTNREIGKIGENIAAKIIQQRERINFVQITNSTGIDVKGINLENELVCVEVKTSIQEKSFGQFLTPGHGFREMSDGWLQHHEVNPKDAKLLGVLINPEKETVTIFEREDSEALVWNCVVEETLLSDYF